MQKNWRTIKQYCKDLSKTEYNSRFHVGPNSRDGDEEEGPVNINLLGCFEQKTDKIDIRFENLGLTLKSVSIYLHIFKNS